MEPANSPTSPAFYRLPTEILEMMVFEAARSRYPTSSPGRIIALSTARSFDSFIPRFPELLALRLASPRLAELPVLNSLAFMVVAICLVPEAAEFLRIPGARETFLRRVCPHVKRISFHSCAYRRDKLLSRRAHHHSQIQNRFIPAEHAARWLAQAASASPPDSFELTAQAGEVIYELVSMVAPHLLHFSLYLHLGVQPPPKLVLWPPERDPPLVLPHVDTLCLAGVSLRPKAFREWLASSTPSLKKLGIEEVDLAPGLERRPGGDADWREVFDAARYHPNQIRLALAIPPSLTDEFGYAIISPLTAGRAALDARGEAEGVEVDEEYSERQLEAAPLARQLFLTQYISGAGLWNLELQAVFPGSRHRPRVATRSLSHRDGQPASSPDLPPPPEPPRPSLIQTWLATLACGPVVRRRRRR